MLPVKWKIFLGINYLQIGLMTIFMVAWISAQTNGSSFDLYQIFFMSLLTLFVLSVIGNSLLNIFLLDRYYPDRLPGGTMKATYIVCFILNLLFYAILCLVFFVGFFEEFIRERGYERRNDYTVLALLLIAFIICAGFYLMLNQANLRKLIRQNHQQVFNNFLKEETIPE